VLKLLFAALIPGSKRLASKPGSVEIESAPLSTSRVGGQGKTFQVLKYFFFFFAFLWNTVFARQVFLKKCGDFLRKNKECVLNQNCSPDSHSLKKCTLFHFFVPLKKVATNV